jgi:hypothetical protein
MDGAGDRMPVGARFSTFVQTGPGALPTTITMGSSLFPGVKRLGCGFDHSHPSGSEVKERVELYICAFMACSRMKFTFIFSPR